MATWSRMGRLHPRTRTPAKPHTRTPANPRTRTPANPRTRTPRLPRTESTLQPPCVSALNQPYKSGSSRRPLCLAQSPPSAPPLGVAECVRIWGVPLLVSRRDIAAAAAFLPSAVSVGFGASLLSSRTPPCAPDPPRRLRRLPPPCRGAFSHSLSRRGHYACPLADGVPLRAASLG